MHNSASPAYLGLLMPLFVAVLLYTLLGGWRRLARAYPATQPPEGRKFPVQSARIGWCSYNNCLVIYSSPGGVYLSIMVLRWVGLRPVFIPWSEMRNCAAKRFWWRDWVEFDAGDPSAGTLLLSRKVFEGYEEVLSLKL